MSYNGRMIEKCHISVEPIPREPTNNIRVISFVNGMIIVAWVVSSDGNTISCVFPLEMILTLDEAGDSIEEYEFIPYLENLTEFDVDKPYNFVFPIVSIQSITVPIEHLLRNYSGQLLLMKKIKNEQNGIQDAETKH